jgi:hypothetical protein
MEEKPIEDKMLRSEDVTRKVLTEYHFAGDGIWFPMAVQAENQEEAIEIYLKTRVLVKPEIENQNNKTL